MRLQQFEIKAILNAVRLRDPSAEVYLFGSRAENKKAGGDIDLLILSGLLNYSDKIKIKADIFSKLEEQKIDIVLAREDSTDPFVQMVINEGMILK